MARDFLSLFLCCSKDSTWAPFEYAKNVSRPISFLRRYSITKFEIRVSRTVNLPISYFQNISFHIFCFSFQRIAIGYVNTLNSNYFFRLIVHLITVRTLQNLPSVFSQRLRRHAIFKNIKLNFLLPSSLFFLFFKN